MFCLLRQVHKINEYNIWKKVNDLAICQQSIVANCRGTAMSAENHTARMVERDCRTGKVRNSWNDNIKKWTGQSLSPLLCTADNRSQWATITAETSVDDLFFPREFGSFGYSSKDPSSRRRIAT